MAASWALLDRAVYFVHEDPAMYQYDEGYADSDVIRPSPWGRRLSREEALEAMKPKPVAVEPPQVSSLSMLLRSSADDLDGVDRGLISSTDKGLVVLYTGGYAPGFGGDAGSYMVYDASSSSTALIPALGYDPADERGSGAPRILGLGESAAILRHGRGGEGAYVLAELVGTTASELPDAELYLCPREPVFRFIPLPRGYSMYAAKKSLGRPLLFRSMGCVCGAIRFVALVGYPENLPDHAVVLRAWTLSPDLTSWDRVGKGLSIADLWATDSFEQRGLPRVLPLCPVLSMKEDAIVYIFLNDVECRPEIDEWGMEIGTRKILKGH
ncbi:hypothetical protein ACP4OV_022423 [Aristida adscensionis]